MYSLPTDEFESFESWYKSRCYFAQVSRGYFALKKYLWEQVYQQQSKTYHLCKFTFSSHDKWQFCKTEMHRIRNIGFSETKDLNSALTFTMKDNLLSKQYSFGVLIWRAP